MRLMPTVLSLLLIAGAPAARADDEQPATTPPLSPPTAWATLSYAQPSISVTNADPRLATGAYESTLTTRDFRTALGVQYFLMPASDTLCVYVGARARLHFLSNRAVGAAGGAFGDQYEKGTKFGGAPFVGLFFRLGPGALAAEVETDLAPIDHLVTGDRNISALALHLGYGLVIGGP